MCGRIWSRVLELGLTLWVLRAPVVFMLFGYLVLGLAPQAQDLLVDVATGQGWYILLFLLATFFVWAATAHYAARLLLDTDARYLAAIGGPDPGILVWLQRWTPRIIGSLAFVAMGIATLRSLYNLPSVQDEQVTTDAEQSLNVLSGLLLISFVLYWFYVVARSPISTIIGKPFAPLAVRVPRALTFGNGNNRGPLVLLLLFVLFTILPFTKPFVFAEWFPRALAVPFVLAGWTPLAVYASGLGRHLRFPIITVAFLLAWTLSYFVGDSYAVRTIAAPPSPAELAEHSMPGEQKKSAADGSIAVNALDRGLGLHNAIDLWKRANQCEGSSSVCPRPILIAASGGASRAGFFTASVIGKLLDEGTVTLPGSGETSPEDVRNRIFAISSVSGSSVGAVMAVAALAASDKRQPCNAEPHALWHGTAKGKKVTGWRDCLEVLTSGDFLTPVFAGLIFRDSMRFLGRLGWSDRATLIEQSWEDTFAKSVKPTDGAPGALACIGSLDCPFLALRPTDAGGKVNWLPLLLLNGASVSTGQRIVTTLLDPFFDADGDRCPLAVGKDERGKDTRKCPILDHAYDFHWLIGNDGTRKGAGEKNTPGLDLRLSTAAHNSARFPLISPPGEVRNGKGVLVDRIVDGGYFENFGAQSAVELARAMVTIDPALAPFVLVVSNDPGIPLPDNVQMPDADEASFLTDLSGPVNAIMNSRTARGTLAADGVERAMQSILRAECKIFSTHVRVWPEFIDVLKSWWPWNWEEEEEGEEGKSVTTKMRPLSFSWWSSVPVQLRLREQTEFTGMDKGRDNRQAMEEAMAALQPPPPDCRAKGDIPKPVPRR